MAWILSRRFVEECVNSPCSQVREVESSEVRCWVGELCAQLRSNPGVKAFCAPDRMKERSKHSRFGMTYAPLTEELGRDVVTLYREGSLAKTYPQPIRRVLESTDYEADYGRRCSGLYRRYDRGSCSWKTAQCLFTGVWEECLETWPQWGTMRNGESWERTAWEPTMNGNGCGFWGQKWMTPTAHDASERDASKTSVVKRDNPLLETQALFFPTPLARQWKDTGSRAEMARQTLALPVVAKLYPKEGMDYVNPGDKCIAIAEERMRKAGVTGTGALLPNQSEQRGGGKQLAETQEAQGLRIYNARGNECYGFHDWWQTEPDVGRVANGMACRVDRLKATGNGQVPAVAAVMIVVLLRRMLEKKKS